MREHNGALCTLHDLLDHDISKFVSAEVRLKNILPEWMRVANSFKLKGVLQRYHEHVSHHVTMLEKFFDKESLDCMELRHRVMEAFIEESQEKMQQCSDPEVRDACLLECIQAINHFKISTYGTNAAFAKALGMDIQANLFHAAEVNEKQIDDRLSQLAEFEINTKAKLPILLPG